MSNAKWVLSVVASLVVTLSAVDAQERDRSRKVCDFGEEGSATVVGRLYAAGGAPDVSRSLGIRRLQDDARCSLASSEEGSFEFQGVPAGRYGLAVAGLTLTDMADIEFEVREGERLWLDIPLFRENRLAACMNNPACATVLVRRTSLEVNGTEAHALLALGYRLGIALAGEEWQEGLDWVACIGDFETVGSGLVEAFPNTADVSECELRETEIEGLSRPIQAQRHVSSDRIARLVRVDAVEKTSEDKATLTVSYIFAPLWGQGHRCEVERKGEIWLPVS